MFRSLALLLLLALPTLATELPAQNAAPAKALSVVTVPIRVFELFRGFLDSRRAAPLRLEPLADRNKLGIRQPGDADSVISPGAPTPSNHFALKPAFEVNDLLLKAYEPDPTVDPRDNRTRGAGAFSPLDARGRPYQFYFGARLVW
jgi:hypothetical protein